MSRKTGTASQGRTPQFTAGATTLYAQLASVLRGRIVSGQWAPDTDLPSIDELCAQYGLGRITVRQALQMLAAEGLVSSQRGRRTVVTYSRDPLQEAPLYATFSAVGTQIPDYGVRVLSRSRVAELPPARWALGESVGPYVLVRKLDHSGGQPYGLSGIYVAEDIYKRFPKGAENQFKLVRLLVKHAKIPVTQGRERVRLAAADYAEAEALGCAMATPVAQVERVMWDESDRVVYYSNTTYHGDRYGLERDISQYLRQM
ncbi:MAG: GntR family transcriptional regulator [Burkholderiaceae bacterium]